MAHQTKVNQGGVIYSRYGDRYFINEREVFGQEAQLVIEKIGASKRLHEKIWDVREKLGENVQNSVGKLKARIRNLW